MRGVHMPSVLCAAAKKLGYDAVALTDRDNLYGLPDFLIHCERNGLRPIIASRLTAGPAEPEADTLSGALNPAPNYRKIIYASRVFISDTVSKPPTA